MMTVLSHPRPLGPAVCSTVCYVAARIQAQVPLYLLEDESGQLVAFAERESDEGVLLENVSHQARFGLRFRPQRQEVLLDHVEAKRRYVLWVGEQGEFELRGDELPQPLRGIACDDGGFKFTRWRIKLAGQRFLTSADTTQARAEHAWPIRRR